jgi:Serine hydrolase (FSH1)
MNAWCQIFTVSQKELYKRLLKILPLHGMRYKGCRMQTKFIIVFTSISAFIFGYILLTYCSKPEPLSPMDDTSRIILGDTHSSKTWIYLCGLTVEFNGPEETGRRAMLDTLGHELGLKIVALVPKNRCPEYDNKLCWPHETNDLVSQTYAYVQSLTKDFTITGYIGFSNGGFFLNRLIQRVALDLPVIVIGAIGILAADAQIPTKPFISIIGKQDSYHYDKAIQFAHQLQQHGAQVTILEHDGGHIMPEELMRQALKLAN